MQFILNLFSTVLGQHVLKMSPKEFPIIILHPVRVLHMHCICKYCLLCTKCTNPFFDLYLSLIFQAWCDDCNQTWHVNNASRRGHGLIRIQRPRLGPASERKMIAGLKAQVKDAQPHRPPPIAAKPKSKAPAKTYQNLPAAAQLSPAAAPVFSRAGPTAASRPVPAPRRSVRNSSEEPIRSEVTSSSNHSTGTLVV